MKGSGFAWAYVTSGVPQGSVLGPILFLIFINDLDSEIINWILKFADDSKLFGEDQSESDHQCLQQDLQKLFDWSVKWQMEFNLDKCKVMHFGRNNQHYKYSMNNSQLGVVDVERGLGILVSSDLKVSSQCIQACSKANRMLGMIKRTIRHKSVDILLPVSYTHLTLPTKRIV